MGLGLAGLRIPLGLVNIGRCEQELLQYATEQLSRMSGLRVVGNAREKAQ